MHSNRLRAIQTLVALARPSDPADQDQVAEKLRDALIALGVTDTEIQDAMTSAILFALITGRDVA